MLHRYNVELYLTYNCMTLYDRTPDSEFRVETVSKRLFLTPTRSNSVASGRKTSKRTTCRNHILGWRSKISSERQKMQPVNICRGRLSGSVRILPWRSTITTATAITTSPAWRRTGVMRCGKSRSMSRIWNIWRIRGMVGSSMCGII